MAVCAAGGAGPDPSTVSGITFGGVALTLVAEALNSGLGAESRVSIWRLVAPTTSTADVVVSFSPDPGHRKLVACLSFDGVNQTNPVGTPVTATGTTSPITAAVTDSVTDDLVLDCFGYDFGSGNLSNATVGANQTSRSNRTDSGTPGGTGDFIRSGTSTEPGAAGTVTMSWTTTAGENWAQVAVRVRTAAGGVSAADTLALTEDLTVAVTEGIGHVYDTLAFTESLQIIHIKGPPAASTWTTLTPPTELDHVESDLAPGDTGAWTDATDHAGTAWTQGDTDCSGTPRTEATISMTQSDMFCDREMPSSLTQEAPAATCAAFAAVSVTAGSGPRIDQHCLEEVPGSSLIAALVVPSVTPHEDVAIVTLDTPYSSATKTVIETPTMAEVYGVMRVHPITKTLVALWPIGPSGSTLRYVSIPWSGTAYTYSSKTLASLATSLTSVGEGLGIVPLADGRWLAIWVNKTGASTELNWAYSQTDGVSWDTPSMLAVPFSATLRAGLAGTVPVIAYSALTLTPALKLRALNLTSNTWGTEFDPSITLADRQFVSLAPRPDAQQFGIFYNESGNHLAKFKIFNVSPLGTITLVSTETVWDPPSMAGLFGTYHSLATAGATWLLMGVDSGNDEYSFTRLASAAAGSTWTQTLRITSVSSSGASQIPMIPRCATTFPIDYWVGGNTLSFRRFVL